MPTARGGVPGNFSFQRAGPQDFEVPDLQEQIAPNLIIYTVYPESAQEKSEQFWRGGFAAGFSKASRDFYKRESRKMKQVRNRPAYACGTS